MPAGRAGSRARVGCRFGKGRAKVGGPREDHVDRSRDATCGSQQPRAQAADACGARLGCEVSVSGETSETLDAGASLGVWGDAGSASEHYVLGVTSTGSNVRPIKPADS